MPTTITHGHGSFTAGGDFCDEYKITKNSEVSERRGTSGNFTKVKSFNETADFSMKGGGDPATALGSIALSGLTGLSGGVALINKYDHTAKNADFDEYETSGKHYPNATLAT